MLSQPKIVVDFIRKAATTALAPHGATVSLCARFLLLRRDDVGHCGNGDDW